MKWLWLFAFLVSFTGFADTHFVLIGDSGKDNDGQRRVSEALRTHCLQTDCHYGLLAGDNVYPVGVSNDQDNILETMFDKYYNQLNIPFLVTLGNHDYGKYSNDWVRGTFQIAHAKRNPSFFLPDYWYTYETPETVVAVIDTSRLMWRKDTFVQAKMLQTAYLKARQKNKWFMVMGHHPFLSNGKHGNAGFYERLLVPFFVSGSNVKKFIEANVCGKADFYLAGHEHSLQVINGNIKKCNTQLVVSGTAASSTKLFKRNKSDFESTQLGFFSLKASDNKLVLKALNEKLETMFEKSYKKR